MWVVAGLGSRLYAVPLRGILGSRKDEKWRSGYQTGCDVIVEIRECNGECWEGRSVELGR